MERFICTVCEYVYADSETGQAWDELADDWVCPVCGAEKDLFEKL